MRNKTWISLIVSSLLAALTVCACSASSGTTEQTVPSDTVVQETTAGTEAATTVSEAPETEADVNSPDRVIQIIQDTIREKAEANKPQVRTLASGVQIQRTPGTPDQDNAMMTYMNYNMEFLNADNRGCGACHTDLGALVDNMEEYPHLLMSNNMGLEIRLNQCMICHNYSGGTMEAAGFGSLMHTIHSASKNPQFGAMGGDCMSCHYASEDGKGIQLWDYVKHQVLRGITDIPAEEVTYRFEWNQEYVLDSADDLFAVNWLFDEPGVDRYAYSLTDLKPDPDNDGVYDQWKISVEGQVDNPFSMTLSELMETFGMTDQVMTIQCGDNAIGMPWIGNFEISGIDVKALLKYAGVQDGSNCLTVSDGKGTNYYTKLTDLEQYGGYLVLQVAGEPLPYQSGYPVQAWMGSAAAWRNTKEVTSLIITTEDFDDPSFPTWAFTTGFFDENGVSYYEPNIGIFDLAEGQIFPAGQSHAFTGYAWSYDKTIAAVELSFDQGNTWVHCETPNDDATRWIYWTFDWTPPAEGAYVVMARSVTTTGLVTYEPVEYLVNVQ